MRDPDNWWDGKKVLVTGANGFLGQWIRRNLDPGAKFIGTDITSQGSTTAYLDVMDFDGIMRVLEREVPDVVIHLAGISHINQAADAPMMAFGINVTGTYNLMSALIRMKRRRLYQPHVVVASSNHVYGSHPGMSARTEEAPLNQLDIYGASKHCMDVMARSMGLRGNIPTVALRHVNAYGPFAHESHITTAAILAGLKGEPLALRGDGTARKEYLYASDVADAYLLLAKHASDLNVIGRAFNASPTGDPPSVREWVEQVNLVLEKRGFTPKPPIVQPPGKGEQSGYHEALNSSELRKWTGWWPRYAPSVGIELTLDWLLGHRA